MVAFEDVLINTLAVMLMLWTGVELVHAFGSTAGMRTEYACAIVVVCSVVALAIWWKFAAPTKCDTCGVVDIHLSNMVGKYGSLVLKTEGFVLAWALILSRLEYMDMDTVTGISVTYVALLTVLLWIAVSTEMVPCRCGAVHMRAMKSKLVREGTIINRVRL